MKVNSFNQENEDFSADFDDNFEEVVEGTDDAVEGNLEEARASSAPKKKATYRRKIEDILEDKKMREWMDDDYLDDDIDDDAGAGI